MKKALIILGHGSRQGDAENSIRTVEADVRARSGFDIVAHAFLQHTKPGPDEVLDQCVREGAGLIVIVPYFLQRGAHVTKDVPALAEKARGRYSGIIIRVTEMVGAHPLMGTIVTEMAQRG